MNEHQNDLLIKKHSNFNYSDIEIDNGANIINSEKENFKINLGELGYMEKFNRKNQNFKEFKRIKKNRLKIKNKQDNSNINTIEFNFNNNKKEDSRICYGSPAIWLKNIKKIMPLNNFNLKNDSKTYRSNSKLKLKLSKINDGINDKEVSYQNHEFKEKDGIEIINYQNKVNKKYSNFNKNEDTFLETHPTKIFNRKSQSPVLIKSRNNKDKDPGSELDKKIPLYQKHPSFTKTRMIHNENFTPINNLDMRKGPKLRTLIYNSSLKIRKDGQNKFSNINNGLKFGVNSTENKDKTEIEETIETGSNLDFSSLIMNKEIFMNDNYRNQKKTTRIKHNRMKKISSILKSESSGIDFPNNSLRMSKTNPNSENSSPISPSESNSDKVNLCNMGSQTENSSSNEKLEIKKSKSDSCLIQSAQSDDMFKTISGGIELDIYLHQTFNGQFLKWKAGEIIENSSSSIVYKALNEEEGSIFVVKRYLNLNDPKLIETFHNEVKIYKQLDHPNIIKFLGSESLEDTLFLYVEYISGGSIKYILDKYGPLNETLIKLFLKQVLEGLEYLHSKGIVHRDIKSANILLDVNGNIKLFDFGCSAQYLENSSKMPSGPDLDLCTFSTELKDMQMNNSEEFLDSLKGTLPWMAPEVVCQKRYGKKADVWSLGCTVLEMATGKPPWGKLDNFYHAMIKIGKSNDIPEIPNKISKNLRDFLLMCFRRNPKERPSIKRLKDHIFVNVSN